MVQLKVHSIHLMIRTTVVQVKRASRLTTCLWHGRASLGYSKQEFLLVDLVAHSIAMQGDLRHHGKHRALPTRTKGS